MKKVIFSVMVVAVATMVFSSCDKDKTNTEMLTNKKGWKLVEATSSPSYELANGSKISNLRDGYLRDFELDDIIFFKEDGALTVDPGSKLPAAEQAGWKTAKTIGTWAFLEKETKIKMQIPFWYPANEADTRDADVVDLNLLDKDNLRVSLTFTEAETGFKYTFALVYAINK